MHFTSLTDRTDTEYLAIIDMAMRLKRDKRRDESARGRVLGLLFFNPSLRTKVSFETAAAHLGAVSSIISPGQGSWTLETEMGAVMDGNKTEHIKEAVQVLSQYVDALGVRSFSSLKNKDADHAEAVLNRIREYATVPVINMESAMEHPCQGLADWMTLRELFKDQLTGKRLVLTWAPHPSPLPMAVPNSVLDMASRSGMDVTLACPKEMVPDTGVISRARANCAWHASEFRIEQDQLRALEGADVVVAKSWAAPLVYEDPEAEQRLRWETNRHWTLTGGKMAHTNDAYFMHCLPVRRNVVVADEVLDSPRAAHIQEAGNRLHVQNAILRTLWDLPY
jgi:N-acetylornithine carbamoyltransferase